MPRIPIGVTAFLGTIGFLLLSASTGSQGRPDGRFDVELVNRREVVAREVLVKLREPLQPAQLGRIAVVDTGIDYTHPDLAPNMWTAPAPFTVTIGGVSITCPAGTHDFNAIQRTCDPMDDHNHGRTSRELSARRGTTGSASSASTGRPD